MTNSLQTRWKNLTALECAGLATGLALVTILGAWGFQAAGYLPCDLCLKQRWAYYMGVPLGLLVIAIQAKGPQRLQGLSLLALALLFAGSALFGAFHAGVEWGFWQGPTDCTGPLSSATSMGEFLQQLQTTKVVRCDAVAIRILGLSLAGWNAIISTAICALAWKGADAVFKPARV